MSSTTATAPARVALAGNPSDAYGGGAVALAIDNWSASVTVTDGPAPELGEPGALALIRAACDRLARESGDGPLGWQGLSFECESTIPREVGLGGSSAIVIATLRALVAHRGLKIGPERIPLLALEAEVEGMGIAAGPQDRVAQACGGLIHVEQSSAGPRWTVSDPGSLPTLFVAYLPAAPVSSQAIHGALRARYSAGEPEVLATMERLRDLATMGMSAARHGVSTTLMEAMDASFEARRSICPLDPRHVRLVEIARAHGAAANYAGSGGAVVGLAPDDSHLRALESALRAGGCGFEVCRPTPRSLYPAGLPGA